MNDLVLEAATEDDLPTLLDLERRCQSHPWTEAHFREEMARSADGSVLVLRSPSVSAGAQRGIRAYLVLRLVASELHVLNLAVEPEHRGRGLGRWLLSFALDLGFRRGARCALLEVRQSNRAALDLYQSVGFEPVLVRRGYYQDPREDAIVLEKRSFGPAAPAIGKNP